MENKKSKKGLVIAICIILIMALLAGGAFYYLKITAPKNVFISSISAYMDTANVEKVKEFTQFNTTVALSGKIETTNEEIAEYANIINNGKITLNVQTDLKKAMVGADIDYQNEKLLQAKAVYKEGDNNIYLFVQDLYDKYFRVKTDKNFSINDSLNTENDDLDLVNPTKAKEITKETLINNLKEEYFYKENTDGLVKNTMKLTFAEFKTLCTNIFTELRDNEEYINSFKNPVKAKEEYNNIIKNLPDLFEAVEKEIDINTVTIEISLYNKLFSSEIQKLEYKVSISEDNEAKMVINKVNNNTYEFSVEIKTKKDGLKVTAEAFNGSITVEKKDDETAKVDIIIDNIPDIGKVTLNMEIKNSSNVNIDDVNTTNSVDFNYLPNSELMKIYTNLTKMKIYPLFAAYFE